ncbi:MAG TPA: group 1 truncated hemoglobin [Polyangiaceae bacterium]|jgi:hemoglobin|nr:group 1 truncated hemoglobin [Polyangiaceae bacterium]
MIRVRASARSHYDNAGGEGPIAAVIASLYDQLFEDPIVGFLFAGKDKKHIVEEQVLLTCSFLGGPQRYRGKPLPEAHAKLPLLPGHFDRRHRLLEQTLRAHSIPESVREAWLAIDEGLRTSVLAAGESARELTRDPESPSRGH